MSQFVTLPPLEKVALLFLNATGCRFEVDASWKSWKPLTIEKLAWLRPYIRPCHQKILNDTISGVHATPLALLRQLLRPYEYRIEAGNGGWVLRYGKPEKGVRIKQTPKKIVWSEPESTVGSTKE
jgi:hypothetical protein